MGEREQVHAGHLLHLRPPPLHPSPHWRHPRLLRRPPEQHQDTPPQDCRQVRRLRHGREGSSLQEGLEHDPEGYEVLWSCERKRLGDKRYRSKMGSQVKIRLHFFFAIFDKSDTKKNRNIPLSLSTS